jgi:hypothetical protein
MMTSDLVHSDGLGVDCIILRMSADEADIDDLIGMVVKSLVGTRASLDPSLAVSVLTPDRHNPQSLQ